MHGFRTWQGIVVPKELVLTNDVIEFPPLVGGHGRGQSKVTRFGDARVAFAYSKIDLAQVVQELLYFCLVIGFWKGIGEFTMRLCRWQAVGRRAVVDAVVAAVASAVWLLLLRVAVACCVSCPVLRSPDGT